MWRREGSIASESSTSHRAFSSAVRSHPGACATTASTHPHAQALFSPCPTPTLGAGRACAWGLWYPRSASGVLKFIERNWHLAPLTARSRDNLPNPIASSNSYVPLNMPAIGDLFEMFEFGPSPGQ